MLDDREDDMVKNATDCLLLNAALAIAKIQQPNLEPIPVNISVRVEDFRILDLNNLMFQLVFIITQEWFDKRLGASNIQDYKRSTGGKMWDPKIVATNIGSQCCNNENTLFWRVYGEEGHVLLSQKMVVTNFCSTNYTKFPFDRQMCPITFGSYRFLAEEVVLKWSDGEYPLINVTESNLKEFHLANISQTTSIISRKSGSFSTAKISFEIKRNYVWYLLLAFIPSVIATILSYLTLWIPMDRYLLRYLINGSTLSYLIFLMGRYNQGTDYLKTIDYFLLKNIVFNLISLMLKLSKDTYSYCSKSDLICGNVNSGWCKYIEIVEKFVKITFPFVYVMVSVMFYLTQ